MSLVGYGSSDSSGSSDEEDNNLPSSGGQKTTSGISKVDSKQQNRSEEKRQPAPVNGTKSDDVSVDEEQLPGTNLFKVLPKPQETQTSCEEISEGDLEDIVKPKSSQSTSLPKPLPLLKGSHVKITIPALDSDSDEEEKVTKKKMKFSGKSRLLDILPPPKHISIKQSNRAFIPYTLNRKPETPESAKKKPPSATAPKKPRVNHNILSVTGYNSDDDDDDDDDSNVGSSNFFSLDSKPEKPQHTDVSLTPLPPPTISSISSVVHPLSVPSAPWQQASDSPHMAPSATEGTEMNYAQYYMPPEELVQLGQGSLTTPDDEVESEGPSMNIDTLLQDEQFLRLQGKNQRGKEQIQLMNVNADDFLDKSVLTKTLTQEMPKHSHKKDKDAPSKKSRNKHQITYLAYQAKERELELKNQWSHNKMTKRQTQAKYGF